MKKLPPIKMTLGELKDSHFREFLGPISEEDVLALKEDSMDRYGDWWASLRVYQCGFDYHLLFGHRRVRAAIMKWGPDMPIMVTPAEVTDEEKIQFLGEAGWRNSTEDERIGLVKLASAFLMEYGEGNLTQVDFDLLKEHTEFGIRYEGAVRISKWLGPRLWPQQRISDVLKPPKLREVLSEGVELLQEEKHEPVQMPIPVVSENQVGHMDLPDDPTAPINPASMSVCSTVSDSGGQGMTSGLAEVLSRGIDDLQSVGLRVRGRSSGAKREETAYDEAFYERRRKSIEAMIRADAGRGKASLEVVTAYLDALGKVINELTGRRIDNY